MERQSHQVCNREPYYGKFGGRNSTGSMVYPIPSEYQSPFHKGFDWPVRHNLLSRQFAAMADGWEVYEVEEEDYVKPSFEAPAQLWLSIPEQEAWQAGNRRSPFAGFGAVFGFWLLHTLCLRLLNRRGQLKTPRAKAEVQHAVVVMLHALLALGGGFFLLLYRDLGSACGGRPMCYDDISLLSMDLHVAFLLYELIFYHKNSKILRPQFGMTLLHHAILIVGFLLTKMFPCRLSLELLPLYQLTAVASLFDALRMLLNQFGAPAEYHFNNLVAMMGAFFARMLIGAAAAFKAYVWIKANDLWGLSLPEEQSILSRPYGLFFIAGPVLLLLIYIKWLFEGMEIVNNLMAAMDRQRAQAAAAKDSHAAGRGKGASWQDRKRR